MATGGRSDRVDRPDDAEVSSDDDESGSSLERDSTDSRRTSYKVKGASVRLSTCFLSLSLPPLDNI